MTGCKIDYPKTPKFIFTSGAQDQDEIFKLYAANKVDAGVSIIIPTSGLLTFNFFAIFSTIKFDSVKSSMVDIIGNIIFILSRSSEVKIDSIWLSNNSFFSSESLMPLTPRKGFSSSGRSK